MQNLIDDFLKPEILPSNPDAPDVDVVARIISDSGEVEVQIYQRESGTFSFRYKVWVGWRDAGNKVRSHSWHQVNPRSNTIVASAKEAKELAIIDAKAVGIQFDGDWCNVI